MACIFSVAEKEFLHTVHKTDSIYLQVQYYCFQTCMYIYRRLSLLLTEFCEICVLNLQDLHTIRISISCGLFKRSFNTWLQKKVLTIRLDILYKFTKKKKKSQEKILICAQLSFNNYQMLTCAGHCVDTKRYNLYSQEVQDTKWCLKNKQKNRFQSLSEAIRNDVICSKRDFSLNCSQFTLKG